MITAAVVPFRAGNTNANTKWQAIINSAPKMSIVAPLPRWSRKFPKMGVIAAAPKGNTKNTQPACSAVYPKLHCSILIAYFWNGKMAE